MTNHQCPIGGCDLVIHWSFWFGHSMSLLRKSFHDDRVILPAEAEAVAHGNVALRLPRLVRHIIQVALRIRLGEVHGWWENLIADRQNAGDELHRARGGDEVAHHALDAADGDVFGMLAKDLLDGAG